MRVLYISRACSAFKLVFATKLDSAAFASLPDQKVLHTIRDVEYARMSHYIHIAHSHCKPALPRRSQLPQRSFKRAFFCSIQFVQQSSVLLARAFSQKTRSLLVEQALLSVEAKLVQPASPCFQCNHLQVPENLPEWLLFDFDFGCAKAKQVAIPLADS